ncbi:hypothetical protein MNEG_0239 [Monoraphidium neglectum]|jgi:hypothetical protein|uniref:Uncharacterized protein n=1 Tax=Monoraphidium neglectum TaxID=145388 RepID=A0A0D2N622_9CHLO|nr:hypothetical protein MNEG_0239 [Monoraphidium neglectum]KIZ07707.1 hypothetical protein MNEG_0239 [Monoraphidium neglectum]|eukprot:XP_013906726.1 hypothetical protein MNEG_0239 [Monoraphidium neglectum]
MYAPEASCGGENSTELASNATTLAVARIAEDYKPTTVKLLTSTLDAMPVGLRKQLTDGLAKQVDLVPPLVGMLPTQVKNVFLSTLCYVATPLPTLEVDPSAPLLQHVAAGKAYSNEGRDLLALLVGDSKAAAIMKTVCDAAPKPRDPPASNGTEPSTPVSSAISYVKGAFGSGYSLFQGARARVGSGITMLQGAAFQAGLLQGAASKLVMNLLPSRAQA